MLPYVFSLFLPSYPPSTSGKTVPVFNIKQKTFHSLTFTINKRKINGTHNKSNLLLKSIIRSKHHPLSCKPFPSPLFQIPLQQPPPFTRLPNCSIKPNSKDPTAHILSSSHPVPYMQVHSFSSPSRTINNLPFPRVSHLPYSPTCRLHPLSPQIRPPHLHPHSLSPLISLSRNPSWTSSTASRSLSILLYFLIFLDRYEKHRTKLNHTIMRWARSLGRCINQTDCDT
jgi:hypothetical protein